MAGSAEPAEEKDALNGAGVSIHPRRSVSDRRLTGGPARRFVRGEPPRDRQAHGVRRVIALVAMVGVLAGCNGPPPTIGGKSPEDEAAVARSEVERGPVRVTVEVRPARARLSDEPKLTLTIRYRPGVVVRKPPFGEAMGDFIIRDFREELPRVEDDHEVLRQVYTLEPTRTGRLSVYPISVTFLDKRRGHDGKEHTLTTEALSVEVASVVDGEVPSLGQIRPLAGPVELPPDRRTPWWAILLIVPVALGAAGLWLWRRRKPVEESPPSPRELAYLELERLLQDGLAERDVKQFYVELTGVVRRYLERATGIRAPEQTTEEFLREIGRQETFSEEERRRLGDFLEAADLVKFAAHRPAAEDIDESFRRAKAFLELGEREVAA